MFRSFRKVSSRLPEKQAEKFVLSMGFLLSVLERWEKDNDPDAPVWIGYASEAMALQGKEVLSQRCRVSNSVRLGNILLIADEEAHRFISFIKQLKANRPLEKQTQQRLRSVLKKHKGEERTAKVVYSNNDEAIAAKRLLAHHYNLYDIMRDEQALLIPKKSAKRFLEMFLVD